MLHHAIAFVALLAAASACNQAPEALGGKKNVDGKATDPAPAPAQDPESPVSGSPEEGEEEGEGKTEAEKQAKNEGPGTVLVATDISDLSLSKALGFAVPASILGEGEGVAVDGSGKVALAVSLLDARTKSQAACQNRRRVKEALRYLRGVAKDLCYVENDAGTLAFDKKYKIAHSDTQSKSIWVDRSNKDKIKVSVCTNDKLIYELDIASVKDGQVAGTLRSVFDHDTADTMRESVVARFDNGRLLPGRVRVEVKRLEDYLVSKAQNRSLVAMNIKPDGLSLVTSSLAQKYLHPDTSAFTTKKVATFARIGPHLAQSLTYFSGDQDGDGHADAQGTASRSAFDNAGQSLKHDASPLLKTLLAAPPENLPAPLGDDFAPLAFAGESWDCSGAEATDPVGTNAQYEVCDKLTTGVDDEDCSVGGYDVVDDIAVPESTLTGVGTKADVYDTTAD